MWHNIKSVLFCRSVQFASCFPWAVLSLSLCTCVPSCLVSGQSRPHSGQIPSGELPPLPKTTSITGPDNTHSQRAWKGQDYTQAWAQVKCANIAQILFFFLVKVEIPFWDMIIFSLFMRCLYISKSETTPTAVHLIILRSLPLYPETTQGLSQNVKGLLARGCRHNGENYESSTEWQRFYPPLSCFLKHTCWNILLIICFNI